MQRLRRHHRFRKKANKWEPVEVVVDGCVWPPHELTEAKNKRPVKLADEQKLARIRLLGMTGLSVSRMVQAIKLMTTTRKKGKKKSLPRAYQRDLMESLL